MQNKSKELIVLIHGFMENKSMWKPLLSAIPAGMEVFVPDLPGHGNNPSKFKPSIKENASDLLNEINEQFRNPSLIIVGHSMGGYVAVEMATMAPEQTTGICFFHSTSAKDSPIKQANRLRAIEALNANKELYIGTMIRTLFAESNKVNLAELINQLIADSNKISSSNIENCLLAMRNRKDHTKFIKQLKIPITFLLGDEDSRLPLSEMLWEIQSEASISHYILEKTGHMSQWEKPEQASYYLAQWLNQFRN